MYVSLNVSRALQDIISKLVYCKNQTSNENFKLKLCMCAQSMALGTHINFSLKFSPYIGFLALNIFARLFWRACKTLVKQPPGSFCSQGINSHDIDNVRHVIFFWKATFQVNPLNQFCNNSSHPFCFQHEESLETSQILCQNLQVEFLTLMAFNIRING